MMMKLIFLFVVLLASSAAGAILDQVAGVQMKWKGTKKVLYHFGIGLTGGIVLCAILWTFGFVQCQ